MISLPIVRWTWGEAALRQGIIAGVLAQAAVVVIILWSAWGARRTLQVSLAVILLAWMAEAVGSHTGFPFGAYHYTAALQPQWLGVPVLIPLAWLMMLPPAWALGWRLTRPISASEPPFTPALRLRFAAASAAAFSAWDLFLDPQMVAWGFWQWEQPGGYFGIPWVNFLGWLLVAGAITLGVSFIFVPPRLPVVPLLAVYLLTWLLQTIGQIFFWQLPGAGIAGFLGMGALLALALRRKGIPAPPGPPSA